MTLLTVILPNYNYLSGFIKNCDQIERQINYDEEKVKFIVSDDSSNNDIKKYFTDNLSSQKRFVYYSGPKLGAVPNWNECIEIADAKYSMFIHHDEYISSKNFLTSVIEILEDDQYDLIILPLIKVRGKYNCSHYPTYLKRLFIMVPSLLFACNPIGSPSVVIYKTKTAEKFDGNLRWFVDVEWYYRFLIKRPKVKILNEEQFAIISDLNFSDTETNDMDVINILPKEQEYVMKKHNLPKYIFSHFLKSLRIPVKIYEFFGV